MTRFLVLGVGLAVAAWTVLRPSPAQQAPATEQQKIESLIQHVATLPDAKFVRNNKEYDAATAAKFLRGKWDAHAAEIKTARDFIDKAASVSSTTGARRWISANTSRPLRSGNWMSSTTTSTGLARKSSSPSAPVDAVNTCARPPSKIRLKE